MKILDRYVIREVLLPTLLVLLVLTFVLMIPTILREAEAFIAKGVAWSVIGRVLLTLLPSSLGISIPVAVLAGILIGFGKLSADREFVAMQACGVSFYRLLRPIAVVAVVAAAADAYEMIVALPNANQRFREIAFNVVAGRAESNIKPRVFFDDFPDRVIYVRDVVPGGWRDVFMADSTRADQTTVFFAKEGRLIVNRDTRMVTLELLAGTRHTIQTAKPEEYEGGPFASMLLRLDAETVFPRITPAKGVPEMSVAELRASIADEAKRGGPGYNQRFMIQQKYSFPAAALVLALLALGLGVSNRKDGSLASFVVGIGLIFIYYGVLWVARALAMGGRLSPESAPWVPNILFGAAGVALLLWRSRSADQPVRISIPAFWRRAGTPPLTGTAAPPPARSRAGRVVLVVRVPHLNLPRPHLLDLYVTRQYLQVLVLGMASLLGIFYIATFIDLADKLFRGSATSATLARYFYFETPQYISYIIPMSALVATLVTLGVMTKNSELVVMKACGVSLYRAAVPLVLFALVASALLYGLQERVLAYSNREADRLIRVIRGLPPQSFGALDRRWTVGENGDIYHYDFFDPRANEFGGLAAYRLDTARWRLGSLTRAATVRLAPRPEAAGRAELGWKASNGWTRTFSQTVKRTLVSDVVTYEPFGERDLALEPPAYFKSDEPAPEQMTYGQLKKYVSQLRTGGYNVVPYMVALQRKVAFPFVTVVMTLLAVPFAVTTGRRGALYGVGVGIVLAIVYWTMLSVFAAIGAGGLLSPMLAAWAPNILFSAVAIYMLLTVRT